MSWWEKIIKEIFEALFKKEELKLKNDWESLIHYLKTNKILEDKNELNFKVVALSQFILESGRGTSKLSTEYLNFAGLKYRPELKSVAEPISYEANDGLDSYCKFPSVKFFAQGYVLFIKRWPYVGFEDHLGSCEQYIRFIKSKGYAEDPKYVSKILGLIPEAIKLLGLKESEVNIYEKEADRYSFSSGKKLLKRIPFAKEGPNMRTRGSYQTSNGFPYTAIVHYTAGWNKPGHIVEEMKGGNKQGLGYIGIDVNGDLYQPANMDLNEWGSHAGGNKNSAMIINGKKYYGISNRAIGIEIACGGLLEKKGNKYYTWFGKEVTEKNRRTIKTQGDRVGGTYEKMTPEQEETLIQTLVFLAKNDSKFSVDAIMGHHNASGKSMIGVQRKTDPGGSLSMTIPQLIKEIKNRL